MLISSVALWAARIGQWTAQAQGMLSICKAAVHADNACYAALYTVHSLSHGTAVTIHMGMSAA